MDEIIFELLSKMYSEMQEGFKDIHSEMQEGFKNVNQRIDKQEKVLMHIENKLDTNYKELINKNKELYDKLTFI